MKEYRLTFQKNIRDLGGLIGFNNRRIKEGRLYRGGALIKVKEEDVPTIKSFKLTDIVDFRTNIEHKYRPDYQIEGVSYHNFSTFKANPKEEAEVRKYDDGNLLWFIEEGDDGFKHLKKTYDSFVLAKEGKEAFKNFFKVLLSKDDIVVYFHCSQGKDRAGFAAYLLEIALGVSHEDAFKDYLLTNVAMEEKIKHLLPMVENKEYYDEEYRKSLIDVFSAKEEYLNSAISKANEHYGSIMNFLTKELEVDIDKLRELYLEPIN